MTTNKPEHQGASLLNVGHMTYLNSEVFYRKLAKDSCNLVAMPPRAMAAAVERGDLAAGPLPIAEVFRLGDTIRSLGNFGVASNGPANSVFLFSHLPVEELGASRVAVTTHTATSIQLLRVLFAELWDVAGHAFVPTEESHDAALWIGDQALKRRSTGEFKYRYDLGAAWKELTGLPFVFAEWVVRSDVPQIQADRFESLLTDATREGINSFEEISRARAGGVMTESDVVEYISSFTYFLGSEERKGQQEFKHRLSRLPVWRPLVSGIESLESSESAEPNELAKQEVIPTP